MTIVATVQNVGTDDVTSVAPLQSTVGTGAETLTEGYELVMNKLDLADGTIDNEVLIHRSFEFSNVPTAANNYQVMVKTAAEARHTCQYDWATESSLVMSTSQTLTFDILRACPEITDLVVDVRVLEDSGTLTYDLSTFVDDEQDDEATMLWDVTADNMDAFASILTDFTDLTGASGTFTVTPINDQFGTVELTYDVVDSHGQTATKTIVYTVLNVNDAPVICDARIDADPDCDNGNVYLYADAAGNRFNSRDEGFTSYTKPLGKVANDTINSFIRDMANEQDPVDQVYTWDAAADCDQIGISLQTNVNGVDELVIVENQAWEEGGICDITLTLEDDGAENQQANPVVIPFSVTPVNDEPVIAVSGQVPSTDASNSFTGELNGNYRVTLVEDTTDSDALTFDLSAIKSDIDHVDADLTWVLEDTNTCTSSNYYSHSIVGDTLSFNLITDATTNAEPWEVDMLNNNGIHQTRTANGYCEMTLTLADSLDEPSYMPNYTALSPNNYVQESVSVTLAIKVDNVVENVPDYYLDDAEGFDFNGVNNIMPGTWVPVDFSINAGGDDGAYTYDHLLKVTLQTDGHTEVQLPRLYTPPAFGTSLDIDDWEVYVTDQTTEVWVEVDVVTCNPGQVCTPASNSIQSDSPESHNAVQGNQVFGKWSEPGRIGESADGTQSNRRPAFEDKNWCNNLMTSNAAGETVAWSEASQCGHTEQGYGGAILEDWQTGDDKLPVTVSTIGALSVASFAPSIIAVALTGLFVSALVLSGRRDDDEEDFMEETISDDESAVSPVIATILMVAITVVLSGVVYVWAAQLADTDTKGVPVVTFSAENVDTGSIETAHWKITIGQAQTVLATQAVEVTVAYINATGDPESQTINLASPLQVYGFSPSNSDSLVTFGDVVTLDGEEVISTFSTGDDIYVKTHLADGTPLVDATIRIIYNPPGDAEGATLKTYRGLSWNQAV
jgi:flagellin-like protein